MTAGREWDAASYHRISDPQFRWGLEVIDRLAARAGERILDAGCGSGRLTLELARRLTDGALVGCDLSSNMLGVARQALIDAGAAARVRLVAADLTALPFRQSFDAVFSTATFHWIRDHAALFRSLHGVLRRGGRVAAQCGAFGNLARFRARADALARSAAWRAELGAFESPWHYPTTDATTAALIAAGFGDVRCWTIPAATSFPGADAFEEFVRTVVLRPMLALLEPERRQALLAELVEAARHDDPPFTLDYVRLNISATAD